MVSDCTASRCQQGRGCPVMDTSSRCQQGRVCPVMDNPSSGPSFPDPRKSVFGHLANFLLLFPNRALSKDSWNEGPCSLSRRFLLKPKRMPEPGPCFQEINRTATPRLYCEGAVLMLSNTLHAQSLLPEGSPLWPFLHVLLM